MNKIIIILFLFLSSLTYGQISTYVIAQSSDFGIGLRVDYQFKEYLNGVYGSISKGEFRLYDEYYVKDHIKYTIGGLRYFDSGDGINLSFVSLGLSYNTYGESNLPTYLIVEEAYTDFSFDIGAGIRINRFTSGLTLDPIRWDFGIYVGFIIIKKQ